MNEKNKEFYLVRLSPISERYYYKLMKICDVDSYNLPDGRSGLKYLLDDGTTILSSFWKVRAFANERKAANVTKHLNEIIDRHAARMALKREEYSKRRKKVDAYDSTLKNICVEVKTLLGEGPDAKAVFVKAPITRLFVNPDSLNMGFYAYGNFYLFKNIGKSWKLKSEPAYSFKTVDAFNDLVRESKTHYRKFYI